ncbi:hypothetical protein [Methanoculleus sp.]|uniref:hypothetical protein n=1 Tax=Methanoculleus sp. TaxID=90427 RepID=UPI002FC8EFC5
MNPPGLRAGPDRPLRDVLANRIEHDGRHPEPVVRKGCRPADQRQIEKTVARQTPVFPLARA